MTYYGEISIPKDFAENDSYDCDFENGNFVTFYVDGDKVSTALYEDGSGQVEDIDELWGTHYYEDYDGNEYQVIVKAQ